MPPDEQVLDDETPDDETPDDETPDDETPDEPAPDEPFEAEPEVPTDTEAARPSRRRWHLAGALIGILTLLLGFGIAVQVHANSSGDALSGLRDDDLIGILDNQDARADRLRQQITELQAELARLQGSGNRDAAARQQAEQEAQALGVLLGTLAAHGPGVTITVTDPQRKLTGEDLLDVVEELRGAGAEAIAFGGASGTTVRIGTESAFEGDGGSVTVDHTSLPAPYVITAIGEPKTLDTALNIPGGVAATVRTEGGALTVHELTGVSVTATRSLPQQKYVKPAH